MNERKYKSQGRQLLEDLSGMTALRNIGRSAGRSKTDPKAIKMKKVGTKRPKSIRKTAAKASSTPMDKERTERIDFMKEYERDKDKEFSVLAEEQKDKKRKARAKQLSKLKKGGKVKPKRRKRKPFEPFITMEAKGGGKVKYRRIGGKVLNGNDITKMIYD
jgi:hypothetical protein